MKTSRFTNSENLLNWSMLKSLMNISFVFNFSQMRCNVNNIKCASFKQIFGDNRKDTTLTEFIRQCIEILCETNNN